MIIQGSKEWFLEIAKGLGELLLGIEVSDDTGRDVLPPVQVAFLVPVIWDVIPVGVKAVAEFPGYRSFYWCIRGNGRRVDKILFDFYSPLPCPSVDVVEEVAEKLGLKNKQGGVLRETGFMGRYHDRLFDTPD